MSSPRPTGRGIAIRAVALSTFLVLIAGCVEITETAPGPLPELSAVDMSAYVPTFSVEVDSLAFARMTERFSEDIEIPAELSLWRDEALLLDAEGVEIEVKGNFSAAFPSKSLGVKFDRALRQPDESGVVRFPALDPEHSLRRVKALRLRNGGNAFTSSFIKDLAYARLLPEADLELAFSYGEPAATYVNGAFYSLHNLRTENNTNGLSRLLGVDEDRLSLASVDFSNPLEVKQGREAFWRDFERALDAGDAETVAAAIDDASFIDFVVAGGLFGVWDWPWTNVRLYAVDEGPIRFVLYDFDLASTLNTDFTVPEHMRAGDPNVVKQLFDSRYADEAFRDRLADRYAQIRESGALHPDRLRRELRQLADQYDPIMRYQVERYGTPESTVAWYLAMETAARDYARRYDQLGPSLR